MQNATAILGRINHTNVLSMEANLEPDTSAGLSVGPRDSRSMVEMTAALGSITLASELGTRYPSLTPVRSHVPSLASERGIKYSRPTSVDLDTRAASRHTSLSAGFMEGNLASELARCGQSTLAGELTFLVGRLRSTVSPLINMLKPSPHALIALMVLSVDVQVLLA
ncbi:hypothetical protein B0H13DRAFT_1906852 [Mycena leptocephala]|nr:hypothetical protein B0H13DRAFT_1906852 [Mycena leptocephala]